MAGRDGKAFLGIWVNEATLQRVDAIAARRGRTRSDLTRELLSLGFQAMLAAPAGAFSECVQQPAHEQDASLTWEPLAEAPDLW